MDEPKNTPPKKGPSLRLVVTTLLLFVSSVGVVGWFVPLASCPTCRKSPAITVDRFSATGCVTCKGEGKVSFVRKWAYDRIKLDLPKEMFPK